MARRKNIKPQYGRQKNQPNLQKSAAGNIINKHGVEITPAERRALESAVNRANRRRRKMIEELGPQPQKLGGRDSGGSVGQLLLMGKENDFIISRKSKSLHQFASREQFENYMQNLERVNSPTYLDDRARLYKRNFTKALFDVYSRDEAKDIAMKVRMMKPQEFMKLVSQDEALEIGYTYDNPQGKLNKIRAALGMRLKEDDDYLDE